MHTPWMSLVIPVFNEQANLPELIQRCLAVCATLHKPHEIILVDDGSSDNSRDIIRRAATERVDRVQG